MTICPIALAAGCRKCPAVSFCPLKRVLGDYKDDVPPSAAPSKKTGEAGDKRPDA